MKQLRQHGAPIFLSDPSGAAQALPLERIRFERGGTNGGDYDERWLQTVVQTHPEVLPVTEIEPAYRPVIPVCMELPTSRGYIDNFFVTPNGNLIFAEVKLWRNTESRREVIAQVMDYVESLTAWTYGELEAAVARALKADGTPATLYGFVSNATDLDEDEFVDAVARNLRLGRGLFFIVGDGIREEAETLANHVQSHAGMHFALALIEIACFQAPHGGGYFIQPRTIARTVNIERGIVRIEDARAVIRPTEAQTVTSTAGTPQSLSAEGFFEHMAKVDPNLPGRLESFLKKLEPLRVEPEFKRSLILRWHAVDGTTLNIGYIDKHGAVWTDAVHGQARKLGILDLTHAYVKELANLVGGEVRSTTNEDNIYAVVNGKAPRAGSLLDLETQWLQIIQRFARNVNSRLDLT